MQSCDSERGCLRLRTLSPSTRAPRNDARALNGPVRQRAYSRMVERTMGSESRVGEGPRTAEAFSDAEPATRRSEVDLAAYAREADALVTKGIDLQAAQSLETVRPIAEP